MENHHKASPSSGGTEWGLLKLLSSDSEPLTREWLDDAMREMPYSTLPLTLYLKQNGIAGNEDLLARLAIACPDRRALALQLGEDADAFAQFYPAEPEAETPDTDTTIDHINILAELAVSFWLLRFFRHFSGQSHLIHKSLPCSLKP